VPLQNLRATLSLGTPSQRTILLPSIMVVMGFPRPSPSVPSPEALGVILAIDYGQKRLGLALSDENGVTSRPLPPGLGQTGGAILPACAIWRAKREFAASLWDCRCVWTALRAKCRRKRKGLPLASKRPWHSSGNDG